MTHGDNITGDIGDRGGAAPRRYGVWGAMRAAIRTPQAIIGLIVVGVFLVLALFSRFLAPHSTSEPSCAVFEPPSGAHWRARRSRVA